MRRVVTVLGATAAMVHITLRAPTAGRVIGFDLQNGDSVRRGEVVAHIISREDEAARNGLAIAEKLDPSEAAMLARPVERFTNTEGVAVTVPQNAIVGKRLVSSGQYVAALDPLADLVDPRSIYVQAEVPVGDLAKVKPGMSAAVTSELNPGTEYPARVAAISPMASTGGLTFPVRLEFSSAQRITEAGVPVEVKIETKYTPDATVIPISALFEDATSDRYHVFVAAGNRARRTPVTIGIRSQNMVQVTSGLKPGQIVITSGGYALSNNLRVNATVGDK